MVKHPDAETLACFARGELPPARQAGVERHLARCADCRIRLATPASPGEYEAAFARAARRVSEILPEVLTETELAAETLERLTAKTGGLSFPRHAWRGLKLAELLREKSREAWASDPEEALEWAQQATEVADRLDRSFYGEGRVAEERALSHAFLGNAWRIRSDLAQAEACLQEAEALFRAGGDDSLTEAELLSFRASLRTAQRRYPEAVVLLDRALSLYREAHEHHRQGRTLIQKGIALGHAGRLSQALRCLKRGLAKIDLLEEPVLMVSARHNLVCYLNDTGAHHQALEALEENRRLYRELGEPLHQVRLRWLEGRIRRDLGMFDEAEAALTEARAAFVERGLGFDAALVSLDLAVTYLRQGKTAAVKSLASEMIPVFEAHDIHAEALAALLLFCRAAEADELTVGWLDQLSSYLRQARYDRSLRFPGGE